MLYIHYPNNFYGSLYTWIFFVKSITYCEAFCCWISTDSRVISFCTHYSNIFVIDAVQRRHYDTCEVCKTYQITSRSTSIIAHLIWCDKHTNFRCDCFPTLSAVHPFSRQEESIRTCQLLVLGLANHEHVLYVL